VAQSGSLLEEEEREDREAGERGEESGWAKPKEEGEETVSLLSPTAAQPVQPAEVLQAQGQGMGVGQGQDPYSMTVIKSSVGSQVRNLMKPPLYILKILLNPLSIY
jgi:hypothetical protein